MYKFSSSKDLIASMFDLGSNKAAHPVVGDNNGGEDFELAEALQSG
jgi:hypothetical protein